MPSSFVTWCIDPMLISETVHRGTLRRASIGASIFVAACELVGIHPGRPDVRLRAFRLVGDPPRYEEDWPDVEFELVERPL